MSAFVAMVGSDWRLPRVPGMRFALLPGALDARPGPGDTVFVWCVDRGLMCEIRVSAADIEEPWIFSAEYLLEYPLPRLPRAWLVDTKGMPRPLPDDLRHYLGARRTNRTHRIGSDWVAELDDARRSHGANR